MRLGIGQEFRKLAAWIAKDSTHKEPMLTTPPMAEDERQETVTGPLLSLRSQVASLVDASSSFDDFVAGLGALMAEPTLVTFPGEDDYPIQNEDVNLVMWQYPRVEEVDEAVQRWLVQSAKGLATEQKPAFYSVKTLLDDMDDLKMKMDTTPVEDRHKAAEAFFADRLRLPLATGITNSDVFFQTLEAALITKYFSG